MDTKFIIIAPSHNKYNLKALSKLRIKILRRCRKPSRSADTDNIIYLMTLQHERQRSQIDTETFKFGLCES